MGSGNIKYGLMALTAIGALGGCDLPPEWSSEVCEEVHKQAVGVLSAQANWTDVMAASMVKTAYPDPGYILSFSFKGKYGIAQTYVTSKPNAGFRHYDTIHINKAAGRIYTIQKDAATYDYDLGERLADDPAVFWGKVCLDKGYFSLEGYDPFSYDPP